VIQPSSGDIRGLVLDDLGAMMVGVDVTLLHKPPSSSERRTKTDSQGVYHFIDLRPGKYEVRLNGRGFCTKKVSARVVVEKATNLKTRLKICSAPDG
jgi:protocatechuate 3,4-dioxygenase beta subunit